MIVLGIETSTRIGSAALSKNGKVVAAADLDGAMNHSEKLLPAIEKIIAAKKISFAAIDRIAVSSGPGSFTGLRIGITVARTIAQMLRKEIVSIPTLDCLAAMVPPSESLVCPLIPAIQGQVYYALYQSGANREVKRVTSYRLAILEKLVRDLKDRPLKIIFTGEALCTVKEKLSQALPRRAGFAAPQLWRPTASWVSFLGTKYQPQPWGKIVPYYIRPSEAELNWKKHGH
ncbi:MAG: tRNA (adenosine(37)-N6)-threonylcarbamoyltransferase complex dimerization subunit type 1 TsaB [bacterium]|nr:tRNA (adenosine(37)-N6)-threonylcarbamoyltransferase complex dimerization subunit type 1 TsaB [bacterium]